MLLCLLIYGKHLLIWFDNKLKMLFSADISLGINIHVCFIVTNQITFHPTVKKEKNKLTVFYLVLPLHHL